MSRDYRATPEQWDGVRRWANASAVEGCIMELRARVDVLEATQQPDHIRGVMEKVAAGSLVDAMRAAYERSSGTVVNHQGEQELPGPDREEFEAMILTVADWLSALRPSCGGPLDLHGRITYQASPDYFASKLREEVERG